MILVIHICETGGYAFTQSSCPSASATDANVGDDPPLVLIHHPFRLGLTSGLRLRMILVIPICETGRYVVTWSSCPSASVTDGHVGDDPPLVLIRRLFQSGLISGLSSHEVSEDLGRTISYVVPDRVLYTCLLGG